MQSGSRSFIPNAIVHQSSKQLAAHVAAQYYGVKSVPASDGTKWHVFPLRVLSDKTLSGQVKRFLAHLVFVGALTMESTAQEMIDLDHTTCRQFLGMKPGP
jgi:hypothetical protein